MTFRRFFEWIGNTFQSKTLVMVFTVAAQRAAGENRVDKNRFSGMPDWWDCPIVFVKVDGGSEGAGNDALQRARP